MTKRRPDGPARYCVFELRNDVRKEIFLGVSELPIFLIASRLAESPPAALLAWDQRSLATVRSVEFDLTAEQAGAFLDAYSKTALPPGWRFVRDDAAFEAA